MSACPVIAPYLVGCVREDWVLDGPATAGKGSKGGPLKHCNSGTGPHSVDLGLLCVRVLFIVEAGIGFGGSGVMVGFSVWRLVLLALFRGREFFIDDPLVRIHFILERIRLTGLAP